MGFVRGILMALITSPNKDGDLCIECLKDIIEFQAKSGAYGLFLTSTAGEGCILPAQVRAKVYEKAREFVLSKMCLLPHVSATWQTNQRGAGGSAEIEQGVGHQYRLSSNRGSARI
ncbi:MAG: dihydrodipicolinate synthase family protein [Desulfurococcaceae archaeon]